MGEDSRNKSISQKARSQVVSMTTELTQLAEIPDLLHHSKRLVESRYIPELKARKLVRECRLFADAFKDGEEVEHREKALEAVKEFSYWLHKRH